MSEQAPSLEEWRRLYEAAIRFKEVRPWEWMMESDVFGIQNPETEEIGYVSIMGMLGKHFALSLYLGSEGLHGFWTAARSAKMGPEELSYLLLETPLLQVSFEDRDVLRKKDRDIIKDVGLKFRGRNAWPLFRGYRPGYEPWFITSEEARSLSWALEQGVEVALRFRENRLLLESGDEGDYLVRVPRQEGQTILWEDHWMDPVPPEPKTLQISVPWKLMNELARVPKAGLDFHVDLFPAPTPIQEEKGARPYIPYLLLMVESESLFIVGMELLPPLPSLTAVWEAVPAAFATNLGQLGVLPEKVTVRSERVGRLLRPVTGYLGIEVTQTRRLEAIDEARRDLFAFLDR